MDLSELPALIGGGTGIAAISSAISVVAVRFLSGRSTERRDALQQSLAQQQAMHGQAMQQIAELGGIVKAQSSQLSDLNRAHADERVACAKQIATLEADAKQYSEKSQHQQDELRLMRERHERELSMHFDTILKLAAEIEKAPGTADHLVRDIRRSLTPGVFPRVTEIGPEKR